MKTGGDSPGVATNGVVMLKSARSLPALVSEFRMCKAAECGESLINGCRCPYFWVPGAWKVSSVAPSSRSIDNGAPGR